MNPADARAKWTLADAALPLAPWLANTDAAILADHREMARLAAATEIRLGALSDEDMDDLVAFLHALTGETALQRPLGRPEAVPSGLPVD